MAPRTDKSVLFDRLNIEIERRLMRAASTDAERNAAKLMKKALDHTYMVFFGAAPSGLKGASPPDDTIQFPYGYYENPRGEKTPYTKEEREAWDQHLRDKAAALASTPAEDTNHDEISELDIPNNM